MGNVLITGADGFVGRAVFERLCETGHTPVAGVRTPERWATLPERERETASFRVLGDLRSEIDSAIFKGIDVVVHLAGRAHVMRESVSEPLTEFREANVHGTRRVALAAIAQKVRRLIFISTAKVHGESSLSTPFAETDTPNPQGPYAVSKFEAECELARLANKANLEIVIIRPPLVYGPGVRANFLRLLQLSDLPVPLPIPDTHNRRSLIAVRNLADFIVHCVSDERAANQTFLLSDEEALSTRELTKRLGYSLGRTVRFLPSPAMFLRVAAELAGKQNELSRLLESFWIDPSKARSTMCWTPPVSMVEQLDETVRWYRERQQVRPQG